MMTQSHQETSNPTPGGVHNTNTAGDGSRVGAQFGVVHGSVNVYQIAPDAPPEEKYRVGVNYLTAGSPRKAEQLIEDSIMKGYKSTESYYYWSLAVLSGRSFDHLGNEDLNKLKEAFTFAELQDPNEYKSVIFVVRLFLWSLNTGEAHDKPPWEHDSQSALEAFKKLPNNRRDEIQRHLDMIISGVLQDQIDALEETEVRNQRMSGERPRRVPKFFDPDPLQPRLVAPLESTKIGASERLMFGGGVALLGLGLALALPMMFDGSVLAAILVLFLWGAGGFAAVKFGLERAWLQKRQWEKRSQHKGLTTSADTGTCTQEEIKFRNGIEAIVSLRFTEHGPSDPTSTNEWDSDTTGLKVTLSDELACTYADAAASPGQLDWLVQWHARETARRWHEGSLHSTIDQLQVPSSTTAGFVGGVAALSLGAIVALITLIEVQFFGAIAVAALVAVGGFLVTGEGLPIYTEKRCQSADRDEYEQRFVAERAEYQRVQTYLADRPTDTEMATWLDNDKRFLKMDVMRRYGLTNRDIVAHLALTEAAPRCRSARVVNGPPRYSAYIIQLFLLTEGGVRQVTVDLDFATGSFYDEHRTAFRYDTIASASVAEVGVRFDGNQRKIVVLGEHVDDHSREDNLRELIMTRSFRLTLMSGQPTDVLVENYDGFVHPGISEDRQHLIGLAMDTSGVSMALRIFEAVAAEGRDWFRRERLQRERRMSDYMQSGANADGRYVLGINGGRSYRPALGHSPDQAR